MAGHLFYSFAVSVDGYIASPKGSGGGQGIGLPVPQDALHQHFNDVQKRVALNLYGRNMYEVMKYWYTPPADSSAVEREFAQAWQGTPKVVFSSTLDSVGANAKLVRDHADTERTVRQLKADTSGEIEVNGATLAASLIRADLVDEFRLYVMPVVLGGGKPYFEAGIALELEPVGVDSLPQQCTLLRFRPKRTA